MILVCLLELIAQSRQEMHGSPIGMSVSQMGPFLDDTITFEFVVLLSFSGVCDFVSTGGSLKDTRFSCFVLGVRRLASMEGSCKEHVGC